MLFKFRWVFLWLMNGLIIFSIDRLNSFFSEWAIYFYIGGLFVSYAALELELIEGLLLIIFTGFLYDAKIPLAFGRTTLLMCACFLALYTIKSNLDVNKTSTYYLTTLVTNSVLIIAISLLQGALLITSARYWLEIFCLIFFSTIFLLTITRWYYHLQNVILFSFKNPGKERKRSQLL